MTAKIDKIVPMIFALAAYLNKQMNIVVMIIKAMLVKYKPVKILSICKNSSVGIRNNKPYV